MNKKLIVLLMSSSIVLTTSMPLITVLADSSISPSKPAISFCLPDGESSSDDSSSDSGSSDSTESGEWTKEGTPSYKRAKEVFDSNVARGLSGAGAAGAVGNAGVESGNTFHPHIVQADASTGNRITYEKDPKKITGAIGTRGYGPYQISPGESYGNWKGYTSSTIKNQTDFIWEFYKGAKINQTNNALPPDHPDNPGGLGNWPNLAKTIAHSKTPEEGAWHWYDIVENGGQSQGNYDAKERRESTAATAYKQFGGANLKPNDSLLGDNSGVNSSDGDSDSESPKASMCGDSGSKENAADGTGKHGHKVGDAWKTYAELPKDLKKYAHDPEKLLGPRGSSGSRGKWQSLGVSDISLDQCVGLSVAYGNSIWGLKGNRQGNGVDTAHSFASDLGIKVSKTPKSGSISSQTSPATPAGHTFVVLHVFANNDVLLVEQNYSHQSGQANGETLSWNFRLASEKELKAVDTVYVHPGDDKKNKLEWGD